MTLTKESSIFKKTPSAERLSLKRKKRFTVKKSTVKKRKDTPSKPYLIEENNFHAKLYEIILGRKDKVS